MELSYSHEFAIDRAEFEYAAWCEDCERVLAVVNDVNNREVLSLEDDGRYFRRTMRVHAKSRMPDFITKLLRKDPSLVTQTLEYDRQNHRGWYRIVSEGLGERMDYRCDYSVEEPAPGRCVRHYRVVVNVRFPAVGGRLEKHIRGQLLDREGAEREVYTRFFAETWPRIREQVMASWPSDRGFT